MMERLGITNTKDFLSENLHFLSSFTKTEDFVTWLISNRVLTQCDHEELKTKPTTKGRAACLIDTISQKGEQGFIAYMQVLEWVYPDIFTSITRKEASKPPENFQAQSSRASVMLLQELHTCMGVLLGDNLGKQVNIEKLKATVSKLQTESEDMIKEMDVFESKWKESSEKAEDLASNNKDLVNKMQCLENEKNDLTSDLTEKSGQIIALINHQISLKRTERIENPNFENHLTKMNNELRDKENHNKNMKDKLEKLLNQNTLLASDLQKAKKANEQQRKSIMGLRQLENGIPCESRCSCHVADKRKGAVG